MADINILHATREIIHVIKLHGIYLMCHKVKITKLIIVKEIYFVKTNINVYQLFEMNYLLLLYPLSTPNHSNQYLPS